MCYERKLKPNMDDVVFFGGKKKKRRRLMLQRKNIQQKGEGSKRRKKAGEAGTTISSQQCLYCRKPCAQIEIKWHTKGDSRGKKEPLSYSNVGLFRLNIG